MNNTIIHFLGILAFLGYIFIAFRWGYQSYFSVEESSSTKTFGHSIPAAFFYFLIGVHGAYIWGIMISSEAVDMGLLNMLSLAYWLMFLMVYLLAKHIFSPLIVFFISCLNIVVLLLDLLLPTQSTIWVKDFAIGLHVFISVLAYSLIGLVVLQASLFYLQERALRCHYAWFWLRWLPALEQNEKLFYELSRIAFIGLSLSILSGMFVLHDWLAQQVVHKTVFTLLAWGVFGVLLFLRVRYVVTPQQSSKWALWACLFLIVGVVGSKLVIEYILV